MLLGAYTLMFGHVLKVQSFPDYPIFLMIGIVVWTFFQQSLLASSESLIDQGPLVRKARFPREAIPASSVTVQLVTFLAILALLLPVALAMRGSAAPALLLLPVVVALLFCFVLGCALIVSVLHAYFRDVAPIVAAALLPWFFLTPIFYQPSTLPFAQQHAWVETLLGVGQPDRAVRRGDALDPVLGRRARRGACSSTSSASRRSRSASGALVFRRMEGELAVVV